MILVINACFSASIAGSGPHGASLVCGCCCPPVAGRWADIGKPDIGPCARRGG